LLKRIFAQAFDGEYEVLVIDSGSSDDTVKIAEEFPAKLTIIKPGEFHHGRTRNLGAALSTGGSLVYITQDALPTDNQWLQRLVLALKEPDAAMVVGRQIPWQDTKPPEKFFYVRNFPAEPIVVKSSSSGYHLDNIFISNVNSAIKRDVWQQFRFSDTIITAEDKEFSNRILAAGWTVLYEPAASVYHAHDLSLRAAFRRYTEFGVALREGAGGLPKPGRSLMRRTLDYFRAELRYHRAAGYLKWLPYSMLYEASKHSGMWLGKSGLVKRHRLRE